MASLKTVCVVSLGSFLALATGFVIASEVRAGDIEDEVPDEGAVDADTLAKASAFAGEYTWVGGQKERDGLDAAALRRFDFKVDFRYLRSDGAWLLFERMLLPHGTDASPEAIEAARTGLAQLDTLTPGDFAAVKRQVDILGTSFDPDEFLSQLETEHGVKPEVRQRRAIGFRP